MKWRFVAVTLHSRPFRVRASHAGRIDYRTELLSREAEKELLAELANLAFKPFEFHGYQGKRYAISYGREYDFRREVPGGRSASILSFRHPRRG